ncbi:GAF domain-containing protein [Falsiroseomonas sp. HC035]|uniref:GAF domain-containing protein n=1 Tax=Falsiroseomonas sp. HC035 TaxID=3390999 RepID=UPI003D314E35
MTEEAMAVEPAEEIGWDLALGHARREAGRLAALIGVNVLDTRPEAEFDALVQRAAADFEVPISLVSLVDADRQWFKAAVGLPASHETPRAQAFCDHAIRDSSVLVVPDAAADPRFSDNPLVTGAPNIRFYAGAPLTLPEGSRLGTLCVIDTVPRPDFSPEAAAALAALAEAASVLLARRQP